MGQADFGKLELNNRNHGGKCQHLSAKRDQFETRSIWNNRRNFLTFALSLWTDEATTPFHHFNVFAKTLYGRAIHKLVILRYFNVFTGTLYRWPNYSLPPGDPRESTQASTVTGLLFSELNAVFAAKNFIFFTSPILLKLGKEESDPTPNDRTTKR